MTALHAPSCESARASLGYAGSYELLVELAAGGMASVYMARRAAPGGHNPIVALKRPHRHLANDKLFRSMLLDEARVASIIDHPNVVKVRELGFAGDEPFVVMDYIEGASLSELRKALSALGRALDVRVAVRIALDALTGLHAAHEQRDLSGKPLGIIHRDVSPHNVLIGIDGRARLTDFGIAKAEDRLQVTRTHEVKGKLAYLAPERVDKRRICTRQSDVFAMAVVLWECIGGRRLFRGEEAVDILDQVMHQSIPRLHQVGAIVPDALDDVLARALSRDLGERQATAAALAVDIEGALGVANVATSDEVARLIEALFGRQNAERHECIRQIVGEPEAARLFAATKLPSRPAPPVGASPALDSLLMDLAPHAPSVRYSFGPMRDNGPRNHQHRPRWGLVLAAVAGLAIGTALSLALIPRHRASPPSAPLASVSKDASVTARSPAVRPLLVPLPLVASRVVLDDAERELDPPVGAVTWEVPARGGTRHRLVAVAPDLTRAEATVVEVDGIARPEEPFVFSPRPQLPEDRKLKAAGSSPVRRTTNGFARLK